MASEQETFYQPGATARINDAKSGVLPIAPQRERGLWSFLTWSFFLSQIVAGQAFIGSAANAGQQADINSGDPGEGQSRIANTLSELEYDHATADTGSQYGEAGLATLDQRAPGDDPHINATNADAADAASMANKSFSQGSAGIASTGNAQEQVGTGSDETPVPIVVHAGEIVPGVLDVVVDGTLVPVLSVVDDLVGVLNPLLGQTLSPVFGTVDGVLEAINPVADQVLTPVFATTDTVLATVEPLLDGVLSPVTDLLDGPVRDIPATITGGLFGLVGSEPLGNLPLDIVASSGDIQFSANAAIGADDLFSSGGYTDYSIELHNSSADGVIQAVGWDGSASIANLIIDIEFSADNSGSNGLPISLSGTLDDLAMRHLGDGLI